MRFFTELSPNDDPCSGVWDKNMVWYGPVGIGMATSCEEYQDHFLIPLHAAFSNTTFNIDVFTCEGSYCGVLGRFVGTHSGTWLGAKATRKVVGLRVGMHFRVNVETELVEDSYALMDIPDVFNQMGINLWDRLKEP